ncbi:MAG: glycosyltransferase family 2 protein [Pseudobutyrivibrio sp.]|nr:glycosyltransferase family 2 protein [Pseudobutyrivibrio sp.]
MTKVCVCITTYNLEDYIETALLSVLNQRTNFGYKIIIADDYSTDNTVNILNKYKELYPDKIEILLSDRNMGSLANSNRLFDGIQCQYFSFLDGDDYWCDEFRLQKQVDFLDNNPEYMMCSGNTQYLRNNELAEFVVDKNKTGKSYTFDQMLHGKMPFFHTSAILVRNDIFINGLPNCYKDAVGTYEECALRGEDFRRILHLEKGPLYSFDEVFSVYRIHEKGIWQGSTMTRKRIEGCISELFYAKYFKDNYNNYFTKNAFISYKYLLMDLLTGRGVKKGEFSEKESSLLIAYLLSVAESGIIPAKNFMLRRIIIRIFFKLV